MRPARNSSSGKDRSRIGAEEGLGPLSAADMRKLERNVRERFGGGEGAYY